MNNDNMEEQTITLSLDDGTDIECNVLGIFEVNNTEYIALLPLEDDEVLLYTYEETEEGPLLGSIESDDEFETVSEAFYEIFNLDEGEDDEDFEEEEE